MKIFGVLVAAVLLVTPTSMVAQDNENHCAAVRPETPDPDFAFPRIAADQTRPDPKTGAEPTPEVVLVPCGGGPCMINETCEDAPVYCVSDCCDTCCERTSLPIRCGSC